MGAQTFVVQVRGNNAKEAFSEAVSDAAWECGHGGYTGTVAEKNSFVMIPFPEEHREDPEAYAEELMDDERVRDKWGPAGCFDLGDGWFCFFGRASS